MLTTENLYHAGHHSVWRRKPKHFCGAGSHHHQRKEPASTVGAGELQCSHPWKHHQGHTHSRTCACNFDSKYPVYLYDLIYVVRPISLSFAILICCNWISWMFACLLSWFSAQSECNLDTLFSLCSKYAFECFSVRWNISKHVFVWCCKRELTLDCMCKAGFMTPG